MLSADAQMTLECLRRAVAAREGNHLRALHEDKQTHVFGIDVIDAALGGSLAPGTLHEFSPSAFLHLGAATGLVLMLAVSLGASRQVLWVRAEFADGEAGSPYGPGLALLGLPVDRVLMLRVTHPLEVLWAMEEALKCRAVTCVIAELPNDGSIADLTATRRLTLAAREGGGFGFLLRHRSSALASSAETRWEVATASSHLDRFGGLGRVTLALSLVKNRRGPTGHWTIAWDRHECIFSALSLAVAEAAFDRSDRAPFAHAR